MSSTEKDVSGSVEDTVTALKKQIEFYFSRENLATDTYLASIMRDRYAPVSKIAEFKKVKSLTTDLDVLLQAMRTSDAVVLSEDETQVKPAFELRRNTIMLREIPRETPEADVRAIFDDPGAAEVKRIRAEMNDNWYVQFEDEDVTLSTFMWLQSQTFNGKPIKARVKTESLLLSGPPAPVQGSGGSPVGGAGAGAPFSGGVASGPGAPFVAGSHNPYAYMGYVPPQYMPVVAQGGYGYNPYMQQPPAQGLMNGAPGSGQAPYYPNAAPYAHSGTDHTYGGRRGGRGGNGGSGPGNANNGNRKSGPRNSGKGDGNKGKDGSSPVLKEYESAESGPNGSGARGGRRGGDSKRGGSGGRRAGGNNDGDSRRGNRNGDRNGKGGKGGNRGGRGKGNNANGAAPANAKNSPRKQQAPDFELGLNSFPPLPAAKGTDPKPTGYDQEFVSYSRESLVGIIRSFADAALSKPEELASSAAPVVLDAPDVSLEVEKPVPEYVFLFVLSCLFVCGGECAWCLGR